MTMNVAFNGGVQMNLPYEIHYYNLKGVHFKTRQFFTLDAAKAESNFLKSMGYKHSLWHYSEMLENYH